MYVTLKEAKQHLNVEASFEEDDEYIESLIEVAEAVVSQAVCEELKALEDGEGKIPSPLRHAALLMVGNFYANREPVASAVNAELPKSYQYLIELYRNYSK